MGMEEEVVVEVEVVVVVVVVVAGVCVGSGLGSRGGAGRGAHGRRPAWPLHRVDELEHEVGQHVLILLAPEVGDRKVARLAKHRVGVHTLAPG